MVLKSIIDEELMELLRFEKYVKNPYGGAAGAAAAAGARVLI